MQAFIIDFIKRAKQGLQDQVTAYTDGYSHSDSESSSSVKADSLFSVNGVVESVRYTEGTVSPLAEDLRTYFSSYPEFARTLYLKEHPTVVSE